MGAARYSRAAREAPLACAVTWHVMNGVPGKASPDGGLGGGNFRGGTGHDSAAGPVHGLAGNRHGGGPPAGCRDAPGERRARAAATAVPAAPAAWQPATRETMTAAAARRLAARHCMAAGAQRPGRHCRARYASPEDSTRTGTFG